MKTTVYLSDFRDAFQRMDRGNQFSYEGLELIYDFLEECDPEAELDVIAICCDFTEGDFQEVANELDQDEDEITQACEGLDEQETAEKIAEFLSDKTTVLGVTSNNTIVYLNF